MTAPRLLGVARRLWDAAYDLDDLRGDRAVSEWAAVEVRNLMRAGKADQLSPVLPLAEVLERWLERERNAVRERAEG